MVRQFMLIRRNRELRLEVEAAPTKGCGFVLARVAMTREAMEEALLFPVREVAQGVRANIMSVNAQDKLY